MGKTSEKIIDDVYGMVNGPVTTILLGKIGDMPFAAAELGAVASAALGKNAVEAAMFGMRPGLRVGKAALSVVGIREAKYLDPGHPLDRLELVQRDIEQNRQEFRRGKQGIVLGVRYFDRWSNVARQADAFKGEPLKPARPLADDYGDMLPERGVGGGQVVEDILYEVFSKLPGDELDEDLRELAALDLHSMTGDL